MSDEVRSVEVEEVQGAAADLDLKVADVAQLFQTTPQTVNRWVREILAKFNIELGYYISSTRWLRPDDIDVIRKYREGALGEEEDGDRVEANGDRVTQEADQTFTGLAGITRRIDDQLNSALDARDAYVADRGRLVAQTFNPDAIVADILSTAVREISGEGAEDLGEIASGAMVQPFRRTRKQNPQALSGNSQRRFLTGENC